ncbi:MAG: hypothetical protein L6Q54_15370 [Leptospiraceae bacterium]|nr:hypothetical protein [Leptospiraceae bacterium]MCK6382614.1 hypothetical protein [Leptospiraceae bacterium]NUM42783.1 hypothetical protein [Leptospiraceae bacterium]
MAEVTQTTQRQTNPMRLNRKTESRELNKTGSVIQQVQKQGGIVTELTSVWKLGTSEKSFNYFSGAEASKSVTHLAHYNFNGKTPINASKGSILAFGFQLYGADYAQFDFSGGSTAYGNLNEASKFLNQLRYEIKKNKIVLREGLVSSLHEPLPQILKPKIVGTEPSNSSTPVNAIRVESNNLENKNSKHSLFVPITINGSGDTIEFNVFLPPAGYSINSDLNDSLLVLNALCVEYPNR